MSMFAPDLTGYETFKLTDGRTVLAPVSNKGIFAQWQASGGKGTYGQYWQEVIYNYKQLSANPKLRGVNQFAVWEQAKLFAENAWSPFKASSILQRFGADPNLVNAQGGGAGSGVNRANEVRSLSALINDMAAQFGIPFTPEQIGTLASTAQRQNYSREQLVDEITKNVDWYKLNAGTIKTSYENYKVAGKQYLVNLSDESAKDWSMRVAKGEMTEETVMQTIRESSKAANPWLSDFIDRGLNPLDVLAPNRDFIAQNLEINPNDLDLMDQKTLGLMTVTGPDGVRKLADQSQMLKTVRNDERWKGTNNAKELTTGMASLLSRIFGRSVF